MTGIADPLGERQGLLDRVGHAAFRLGDPEPVEERREAGPLLGLVDRLEVGAEERHAGRGERRGEVERRLAAERDDGRKRRLAFRRLGVDDAPDALDVERLEVEPRGGVEVGRDGLRVRVDHHRAPALAPEDLGRLDRAVVELDPLPDPDRPASRSRGPPAARPAAPRAASRPRHTSSRSTASRRRTRRRTCRPSRSRARARSRAARPDRFGGRRRPGRRARDRRSRPAWRSRAGHRVVVGGIDQPRTRGRTSASRRDVAEPSRRGTTVRSRSPPGSLASGTPRRSRPRIRHSRLSDGLEELPKHDRRRRALREARGLAGVAALVDPADRLVLVGVAAVDRAEVVEHRLPGRVLGQRTGACLLEAAQRLVERGPERPVDRHHLAGRLHLAAERPVGRGELVEREARQLDDDVVEGRLEGGDGRAGDDVRDLGESPADGDLGGDAGDRVAGRLAGERGRARDPRVDLDDRVLGRVGREGELDVAAALDAERPDDREGRAAQPLVERRRCRVWTGATTIESPVWTPSGSTFSIEQTAMHVSSASRMTSYSISCQPTRQRSTMTWPIGLARRPARTRSSYARLGLDDPAAGAAERERRAHDRRQADLLEGPRGRCPALFGRRALRRSRTAHTAGRFGRGGRGSASRSSAISIASSGVPSSRTSIALEHAGTGKLDREVERGLAAEPGEEPVGPLPFDDGGRPPRP